MEKREFHKKEFAAWFKDLEKTAKKTYHVINLDKNDFKQPYIDGLTTAQAIENFLYS